MLNSGYSHTSNTVKLYKHLDKLALLQNGIVSPIMVHIMPTHRCQMNCVHCCFKNRENRKLDMPLDVLKNGVNQFYRLGTRSIEITGGGEPTLYPHMDEALAYLRTLGMNIGFITNTLDSQLVKNWAYCDWIRISLNAFDYDNCKMNIGPIKDAGAYMSGCYIWNDKSNIGILEEVARFSKKENIITRVAPDCIKPVHQINYSVNYLKTLFEQFEDNEFIFLSDFNITTYRPNMDCYIHMIKPCFYTDGWIYSCPSAELAFENNFQISPGARICHHDEVYDFYKNGGAIEKTYRDCSYCKYVKQQIVLEEVLTKTTFDEFA